MMLYVVALLALLRPDYPTLIAQAQKEYRIAHFEAASQLLNQALALLDPQDQTRRASTLATLGNAYAAQERFTEAERAYSEALKIRARLDDKNGSALVLHDIGMLYSLQQRYDDAARILKQAADRLKSTPTPDPAVAALVLNGIGIVEFWQGKNAKAESAFKEVLRKVSGTGVEFDTTSVLNNLGNVYMAQKKFMLARDLLNRVLEMKEASFGLMHPNLVFTLIALGNVDIEMKEYSKAEDQLQRALGILEAQKENEDPSTARVLFALSTCYSRSGQKLRADATLAKAAELARANLKENPDMRPIVENYSVVLRGQGRTKEAEELLREAKRADAVRGMVLTALPGR
jgi:tetratricopeptide (TPR) repeat protein